MAKIVKKDEVDQKASTAARRPEIDVLPDEAGVVHKRVIDARAKADEILAAAETDAERIRGEAEAALAQAKREAEAAVKRGYAEGESKGLAQVTEKLLELQQLKADFYEQAEPETIRLVMAIAEKVIGRLVEEHRDVVVGVVRQALERAIGDRITVRLHPEDYKTVTAEEGTFREVVDRTRRLTFREDESIARGGCIVETEVGTIDAQLETQLKAIRKALVT